MLPQAMRRSVLKTIVGARAYSTEPAKHTASRAGNNETLRYLDQLKDSEIEFQSKGEHVSGDFWKTEPGKYRDQAPSVSRWDGVAAGAKERVKKDKIDAE